MNVTVRIEDAAARTRVQLHDFRFLYDIHVQVLDFRFLKPWVVDHCNYKILCTVKFILGF